MSNKKGKVTQIIGPVVDFKFDAGQLPEQGNAIEIKAFKDMNNLFSS